MADNGQMSTFLGLGVIVSVLIWSIPRVYSWGRRRNPDIAMDGREMVWAKQRVSIDSVDRWSVRRQTSMVYNGTTPSRMTIGVLSFQLIDGEEAKFTFPHLDEAEQVELIAAIDPILPGRRID